MIVVSDASPLIALATIDQLEILRELYSAIVIPQAVVQEITVKGPGGPGYINVNATEWISVKPAKNISKYESLSLGKGETEAIALTLEINADLLILDEVKARREASKLGIKFVGILGILIEAKAKGVIDQVKPILESLRDDAGFWISQSLIDHVLSSVGEQ